jgi:acetyl esterase/lipase
VSGDDPPTFLYHGTFDILVRSKNAHDMYGALNRAGVPAELYLVRGVEHSLMFRLSPVDRGVDFLNRRMGDMQITRSSGITAMHDAVVAPAQKMSSRSGTDDGKPMAMWTSFAMTFKAAADR